MASDNERSLVGSALAPDRCAADVISAMARRKRRPCMNLMKSFLLIVTLATIAAAADAPSRPNLFFREDWRETPAATPVTQEHVANADLLVTRYGPSEALIKKSHHDRPADDPFYIWSGDATANWAITLKHKASFADLTGQAKIRWRSKQSGFRELRIIVKLADGKWLIADQSDGPSEDWRVREFNVPDLRWRAFDPGKIVEGRWAEKPDVSKIDEIGWTDLMPGGGTPASSRVDWIEVDARPVPRG